MSEYKLTSSDTVIRTNDNANIPVNPDNPDYAEFLKWQAAGGVPDPYVAPLPSVPETISDRQFFQQLAIDGIISEDDALASNAAVIPPPLLALVDQLPTDKQFAAKMLIGGATVFEFNHPLTIAIGQAYGWTDEQRAEFFIDAAKL